MKLDLGSGKKPMDGFLGVDKAGVTDFQVNLIAGGEPWPFEDGSVDELWSNHFIEHIDAVNVPVWEKVEPAERLPEKWRGAAGDSPYRVAGGFLWRRTERERDALHHFFCEAFRIARPGAKFTVIWPCLQSRMAYRDSTHRRFIDTEFIHYLGREGRRIYDVEHYDIDCNWVGSATDIIRRKENEPDPSEEELATLRWRSKVEWNVTDESMMQLVADKS